MVGRPKDIQSLIEVARPAADAHDSWRRPVGPSLQTRLRAVVLLGGAVRATALQSAIGRSVMNLPVDSRSTLLSLWRRQVIELAGALGRKGLPMRLMLDRMAPSPDAAAVADDHLVLSVERDPVEYRGTGGVVRDLAAGYKDDDLLLIANAAQVLRAPLGTLVEEMVQAAGDFTIISHTDGTPAGMMLARCGCLRQIPAIGFVDLKEQALPALARCHRVRVVERERASGFPVRTLGDYVEALRRHHADVSGDALASDFEDCRPLFSIVEVPADVHHSARIHNSVVLRGGRVEEGAVVVGSVVCPGGVVRRGSRATDELVGPLRGKLRR
jgi:mannose-1-phosphate guanylyltransferase